MGLHEQSIVDQDELYRDSGKGFTMTSKDYYQHPRVVSVIFIANCRGLIALIPMASR